EVAKPLPATSQQVREMVQRVDRAGPLYAALLAAPPLHGPGRSDPAAYDALDPAHKRAYDALQKLREAERGISTIVNAIRDRSMSRATLTKDALADNERTILI